jgi:CheY-like chemotaxis protein
MFSSATNRELTGDSIRAQLARILASAVLRRAPRLKRLLSYLVESTLRGESHKLKDYTLGIDVFDRAATFDPRLDTIVRVQMRRLRVKLDQYAETSGRNDPIEIRLRPGDYQPIFVTTELSGAADRARVLIVEDERVVARGLEMDLERLGFHVAGAVASGDGAIRLVAQMRPDVVLMDITLSGAMSGTDAASVIWKQYHTPVVYLTGHSDPAAIEAASATGSFGYVVKPYHAAALRAALGLALACQRHQTS